MASKLGVAGVVGTGIIVIAINRIVLASKDRAPILSTLVIIVAIDSGVDTSGCGVTGIGGTGFMVITVNFLVDATMSKIAGVFGTFVIITTANSRRYASKRWITMVGCARIVIIALKGCVHTSRVMVASVDGTKVIITTVLSHSPTPTRGIAGVLSASITILAVLGGVRAFSIRDITSIIRANVVIGAVLGGVDAHSIAIADFPGIDRTGVLIVTVQHRARVEISNTALDAHINCVSAALQGFQSESITAGRLARHDEIEADDANRARSVGADRHGDIAVGTSREAHGGRALTEGPVNAIGAVTVSVSDAVAGAHREGGLEGLAREARRGVEASEDRHGLTADIVEAVEGGDTRLEVDDGLRGVASEEAYRDGSFAGGVIAIA